MEWIELVGTILRAIFTQKPTIEIAVITLVVFTALLWLNIGVVNLWNKRKRKKKSANTPVSEQKEKTRR